MSFLDHKSKLINEILKMFIFSVNKLTVPGAAAGSPSGGPNPSRAQTVARKSISGGAGNLIESVN